MNIPCANKLNFCPCTENPLANLSSEEPDREQFIHINYNTLLDGAPVVLCEEGSLEDLANCPNVCNPDLQTCPCDPILDNCPCPDCPPCQNPPCSPCVPPPPCNPIHTYYNAQTTCTQCGITYTLPAGVVVNQVSQANADAIAQSICQSRVNALAYGSGACGIESPCIGHPRPIISGIIPAPPIYGRVGHDLTITVAYTFSGPDPLTFTWYKDFTPFQVTPTSSLVLTNLDHGDAGIYQLRITLPSCPGANSSLIQLLVLDECDHEPGLPAPKFDPNVPATGYPFGLGLYDWTTIVDHGDFVLTPTFHCGGVVYGRNYVDCGIFPDGFYDVLYTEGAWDIHHVRTDFSVPCNGSPDFDLYNVEKCGFQFDAVDMGELPIQGISYPNCNDAVNAVPANTIVNTSALFDHFVGGGHIRMWSPDVPLAQIHCDCGTNALLPCPPFPTFKLRQYELEPFPAQVRVRDFTTTKAKLTMCALCEPRVGNEWDGTFPGTGLNRNPDTFSWTTDTDSSLVSLNGKRMATYTHIILAQLGDGTPIWVLEIHCKKLGDPNFGPGEVIWAGYKDVGRDPTGIYLWDPTVGATGVACTAQLDLPCIEIESY